MNYIEEKKKVVRFALEQALDQIDYATQECDFTYIEENLLSALQSTEEDYQHMKGYIT